MTAVKLIVLPTDALIFILVFLAAGFSAAFFAFGFVVVLVDFAFGFCSLVSFSATACGSSFLALTAFLAVLAAGFLAVLVAGFLAVLAAGFLVVLVAGFLALAAVFVLPSAGCLAFTDDLA